MIVLHLVTLGHLLIEPRLCLHERVSCRTSASPTLHGQIRQDITHVTLMIKYEWNIETVAL